MLMNDDSASSAVSASLVSLLPDDTDSRFRCAMPPEPVFSLAGLKLPLNSPRQRINGQSNPILGYEDPFDPKYDRGRMKRGASGSGKGSVTVLVIRTVKYAVVVAVILVRHPLSILPPCR